METFNLLYNHSILLQFLGAIIAILFTVLIIYIKRELDRTNRKNYYLGIKQGGEILGDIDIKVNEELPSENFIKLITMWALQPLLLLLLISFIDHNLQAKIFWCSLVLLFTILHEFITGLRYSHVYKYQLIMLLVWLISFAMLSYEKNTFEQIKRGKKIDSRNSTALILSNNYL